MIVKSLYMPDSSIQGDKFPAHVIWDRTNRVQIRIKLPPRISIEETYNVPKDDVHKSADGWVELSNFDVNGYVGFVMRSDRQDRALTHEEVLFEVISKVDESTERQTKRITLFRPSLEVVNSPGEMRVRYNSNSGWCKISDKIQVRNVGAGTALIEVGLGSEKEFAQATPKNIEEFSTHFLLDLQMKLKNLAAEKPNYSELIEHFLLLIKEPVSLAEEYMAKVKAVYEMLEKVISEDEEFVASFASAVAFAYLRNVQIITELTSFGEYLDSIGEGRVIILNSVREIKPKKDRGTLLLTIRVRDLANAEYPQLTLPPIAVRWDGEGSIPIHQLFDWKTRRQGGTRK